MVTKSASGDPHSACAAASASTVTPMAPHASCCGQRSLRRTLCGEMSRRMVLLGMYGVLLFLATFTATTSQFLDAGNALDERTFRQFLARKLAIRQQLRDLEQLAIAQAMASTGEEFDYEDAILSTPELIVKYGYPVESHDIVTQDGYILTFHRIPYGKNSKTKIANSRPLFLQHGLMSSSDDWIVTGPEHGFGYILADAGYDVWLGNARGNKWSRRHVRLDPEKGKFWEYSWHEMGVYDLPAAIDYILCITGKKSLHYVGHSMGTTSFIVMGILRPEYSVKIRVAVLLAPAVFFAYRKDLVLNILVKFTTEYDILSRLMGINEVITNHTLYTVLGDDLCKDGDPTQTLCIAFAEMFGVNTQLVNMSMLPVFLGHFPSGSSTRCYLHYGQSIDTGEFRQYDYGILENLHRYRSLKPPKYNVKMVDAPIFIHYSIKDGVTMPEDVLTLIRLLPHLIDATIVPEEDFNHMDFVIAEPAKELVYNPVIRQLDRY